MAMLCPPGITMHYARLGGYDLDEIPDEQQMSAMGCADISEPLRLIAGVKPDVIIYGCTSATLTHGPGFDRMLSHKISAELGIPTITAAGAIVHALRYLKVRKIGFASPYVAKINLSATQFLEKSGFLVVSGAEIGDALDNYGQGNLLPERVCELARSANSDASQAIVLSCTDMRAVETVDRLEAELSKPVITSNQAMLFSALRAINVSAREVNCGALFRQEDV